MTNVTNCFFILLSLSLSSSALAKTLVVTDIDDTLKIAHVASTSDSFKRAYRSDLHFSGMTELFQLLKASTAEIEFAYVSNAPARLMETSHKKFLKEWGFPQGAVFHRPGFTGNHKEATITALLERVKPDVAIFMGDNSEMDGEAYTAVVRKFPGIRSLQFLRIAYSDGIDGTFPPVQSPQLSFVTPVEIVLALKASGDLPVAVADSFLNVLQQQVSVAPDVGMGPGFFPDWLNCADFKWSAETYSPALAAYNQKITERCKLH